MDSRIGYDTDFLAWTEEQARLLREAAGGKVSSSLDFANLAEEVESIGRRDVRDAKQRLRQVITGLLRCQYVPNTDRDREFRSSILYERFLAEQILKDSPSLPVRIELTELYESAVQLLSDEIAQTGNGPLPAECPYSLDQLLDSGWWPTNRHGLT
ncbi:protein of unknown function DUF29 [Azospirillum oryzae]|uniref:DUF29 domain-containing protein n=1 Tax=Azospirillum oryzae TaxID=286727 RepID=A0A1X7GLZ6_9PROT|nr:DUF29 domain-containing protein [Azospirillum oryzae]SMF71309.1 protein of unknown function DUF29 [Azospirillum oryzae]